MLTWHSLWGYLLIVALVLMLVFGLPAMGWCIPESSGLDTLARWLDGPRTLREWFLNKVLMSWLSQADARALYLWWSQTSNITESLTGVLIGLNVFAVMLWPLYFIGEGIKWINNTYKRSWQRSVDQASK